MRKGNAGFYEWFIRLPKKPSGEINICIQCGVLKANAFTLYEFDAVEKCAAETGEPVEENCTRHQTAPGLNPIVPLALPRITAIAYPGPYNPYDGTLLDDNGNPIPAFVSFHLTAFKNPGTYAYNNGTGDTTVLNGSNQARILLKSCMDKCIVVKLPVFGSPVPGFPAEMEYDLEAGDVIYVKMTVPITNTVDIYCHAQSARIMGIGEAP